MKHKSASPGSSAGNGAHGLTLVEVMLAWVVLLVAFLGFLGSIVVANDTQQAAEDVKRVYTYTQYYHEILMAKPFREQLQYHGITGAWTKTYDTKPLGPGYGYVGYTDRQNVKWRQLWFVTQINLDMNRLETIVFRDLDDDETFDQGELKMRMVSFGANEWAD